MIAPLPQHPPTAGASGTQPDQRAASDNGFVQVMAASATPRPARTGSPPEAGHGRETMSQPLLSEVDAPTTDSPATPAGAEAIPAGAEVFNQHGFFGDAIEGEAAREVGARGALMPRPLQTGDAVKAGIETVARPGTLPSAARGPAAAYETFTAQMVPERHAIAPRQVIAGPIARGGMPEAKAPERSETTPSVVRRAVARTLAAQTPVAVALHELGAGLHVAARTDALDEGERMRLHDEIAALLARHGLSARSIRISAPLAPAPPQEKFR